MKPRGALMIEHRLIEKMLAIAAKQVEVIKQTGALDPVIVDTLVDFVRTYADRTHHGKEEDILFRDLKKKDLSPEHQRQMQELVDDHAFARNTVVELVEAKNKLAAGDESALNVVARKLSFLVEFYPKHIRKEDTLFFPNTEKYFSAAELDLMLKEFWEFDRQMIHEKYRKVAAGI